MNYIQMIEEMERLEKENDRLRDALAEREKVELSAYKDTVEQKTLRDAIGGYNCKIRRAARMALDHLNRIGEGRSPARHELESALYRTPKYIQLRRDAKMAIYALREQKKAVRALQRASESEEAQAAYQAVLDQLSVELEKQSRIRAQYIPVIESNLTLKEQRNDRRKRKAASQHSSERRPSQRHDQRRDQGMGEAESPAEPRHRH